jgi:uncharacterized membrane protein
MSVIAAVLVVCGFAGVAEAARGDGLTNLIGETGAGLLIIGAGLFSIAGGVFAWPFFMNHRKAQFFVRLMGFNGARGLYVVLGAIICFFGIMTLAGKSKPQDASANVTRAR